MAGAGYKSWVDGDILTAADVNTYLMQQAVMRFADASARSTAITAPSEGMVTYLVDTDAIEYYDGAAWQPILDQDVIEAKGDLIAGTADDTVARLPVGTNGQFLVANSGETTGLKWTSAGNWTSFTPSWSNFTPGNAVEDWSYCIINETMIITGRTVLGTTSVMGTGPLMTLPGSATGTRWSQGSLEMRDEGTAFFYGNVDNRADTFVRCNRYLVSGSNISGALLSATAPFTWTNTDYFSFTIVLDIS